MDVEGGVVITGAEEHVCEGTELEVIVSKSTGVRYRAENQVGDFGLLSRGQRKRNDIQNKHFITKRKKESEVAQSCRTLCDPVDCSLQRSSVHGIFQTRVLEWVAIASSRGSSRRMDRTRVSHIVGRRLTIWATRELSITVCLICIRHWGGGWWWCISNLRSNAEGRADLRPFYRWRRINSRREINLAMLHHVDCWCLGMSSKLLTEDSSV